MLIGQQCCGPKQSQGNAGLAMQDLGSGALLPPLTKGCHHTRSLGLQVGGHQHPAILSKWLRTCHSGSCC
jgi:hypothetical protein